VRKANTGQAVGQETALGAHSDFARASQAVVKAIMAMQRATSAV
jgi:hypothetical protein